MILKHQHFDLLNKTILERAVFKPPLKAKEMMHDEACFLYAVQGTSTIYGGTEQHRLQSDEGVLMKCGSYINAWHRTASDQPFEAVVIHFYPEIIKFIYQNEVPPFVTQRACPSTALIQKIASEEAIQNYIHSLLFYFDNPSLANDELVTLKVKELILLLYNTNHHGIRDLLHDLFNPSQLEFKEVIKSKLFEDLSVEDYAQLTHLSLSSFKRKFKETFGESPARYIKTVRLKQAADRLKVSSDRISDIGYDCGFNDLAHFSKSFAARYGTTPSAYRKAHLDQIHK
jgi:AraC-like DNA-binding protein